MTLLPPSSTAKKFGLVCFAGLQNALAGGIVFGWASISRTLLGASPEEGGAGLSSWQTTALFSLASAVFCFAPLCVGPLLDKAGPRTCLAASLLLVAVGSLGFCLSQQLWHFQVAVSLIAFGGPGIGLAIIHNTNLFPHNQFLAVSCLAGTITLSFTVLAVLEALWEQYHMGFRALFAGYGGLVALTMIATLFISPDEPFEMAEPEEDEDLLMEPPQIEHHLTLEEELLQAKMHTYAHNHQNPLLMTDQSLNSNLRPYMDDSERLEESPTTPVKKKYYSPARRTASMIQSKKALKSGNDEAVKNMSLKDQPFWIQFQSSTFSRAVLIFVVTSFMANFSVCSLNIELEDLDEFTALQQHALSQQFTWMLSLGMPYALLVGWLMDGFGLEVCTFLTLLLGQVSTLLMVVASLDVVSDSVAYAIMFTAFAIYSLFRQFLYPVFLGYISARLGFKYFGILSGIGYAVSGVVQWFMADLASLVHHGWNSGGSMWIPYHVFQIALLGILMIVPLLEKREMKQREENMKLALENQIAEAAFLVPAASTSSFDWSASPESDPLKRNSSADYGLVREAV